MEMKSLSTRVPAEWADDADEMDVSTAEYVRRMARAGRRDWGYEHDVEPEQPHVKVSEHGHTSTDELASILDDIIVRNLSTTDGINEDDLVDLVTGDIHELVKDRLEALMDNNSIDYRPRQGGWVKNQ